MTVAKVNLSMNAGDESPEAVEAQRVADEAALAAADKGVTSVSGTPVKDGETVDLKPEVIPEGDGIPQRPEAIPEKFWNAETGTVNTEAMVKEEAYLKEQAEKDKAGESKTKTDSSNEGDDDESGDKPAEGQSKVVEAASAEYAEKGELSDATYASLETQGLGREMVDAYISGQKAAITELQDAAYGAFDGAEGFTAAQEWAREKLSDDDIAALDIQITSNNPAIVAAGAKSLKSLYEADVDITPSNKIIGDSKGTTSGGYFKSTAEMQGAMSDPKYKVDPAFRQEVADKIARAGEAGVNLF